MKNQLLLIAAFFFISLPLVAQQPITGKVTDNKGIPLPGVSVKVKGTSRGTSTNDVGNFSIQAAPNDQLEISIVGYKSQTISVGTNTPLSISLESEITELGEIVFVGTRAGGRAKTETPVPVDIIKINDLGLPTAKMDLTSVLNIAAPSFNYNKQSGADGADHIDIGTLRGLGPDHTLVLINGKRRHPTAFVGLFGTRGRANSGVDMNGFPVAAVDRIEILRDGASAQYGSDAIAGVINLILKKNINKWDVKAGWSGYYDTKNNSVKYNDGNQYYSGSDIDGNAFNFNLNNGWSLGKRGGFFNLSLDFFTQGKTYRQADTTDPYNDKNSLVYLNTSRRAFGDASVTTGGAMYNMEVPGGTGKATFYSFGGYNYKSSDAFAYTRNLSARPDRYPVDQNYVPIFVPSIMRTATDGEVYYNPHIQTHITDASFAAGVRGNAGKGWHWDLSNNTGYNDFHFFGDKTFNASLIGQSTPNHFDDGGFNFLQNTTNLDFSRAFGGIAEGLNLGIGAEFRYEKYKIYAGEDLSYKNYDPTASQASGSQGFPGFSSTDEVDANRSNVGVYADAELNVTHEWLIDGAVRFENYSDFGSVFTGKFATRYKISDNFNLRGSVSTGFRAPSLAQIHFSNTLTSFSAGQLSQSLIAPNTSSIARAAGIPDLKEETSVNGSLGFSWKPATGFTITVDGYIVKIKDRVVLSGLFNKDDTTLNDAFRQQFPADVSTAQFFANAVSTTNMGVDVVFDYSRKIGQNTLKILLAGNVQNLEIDDIHVPGPLNDTKLHRKTFYSDREEAFLEASAPDSKFTLSLGYTLAKFAFGATFTSWGKIKLLGFGDGTAPDPDNPNEFDNPNYSGINPRVPSDADPTVYVPEVFNYTSKITTDIYGSYKFSRHFSLFIGADNIFNLHPDLGVNPQAKGYAQDNESGGPWDSVQMGFNGRRLFAKLAFIF
jgi:iron complex outermembrane receptor protein